MDETIIRTLSRARGLRAKLLKQGGRIHRKAVTPQPLLPLDFEGQLASDLILESLANNNKPCMICRFGSTELAATLRYLNTSTGNIIIKSLKYITGEIDVFWWDEQLKYAMRNNAGFFPVHEKFLLKFGARMINDIQNIDILGSWLSKEEACLRRLFNNARIVRLEDLEPYYHQDPWSIVLEGKTVLVIHPFEESIKNQYRKRTVLFNNPKILPQFELKTLKCVQSIGGNKCQFANWFDALNWMCDKVAETHFDIAIIGAGAYGLPLASFIKSIGKKAVHLGGATQILFGIRGRRWDQMPFFNQLFNCHWVRPLHEETPANCRSVENGCYW